MWWNRVILVVSHIAVVLAFYNVDELKNIYYDLGISAEPTLAVDPVHHQDLFSTVSDYVAVGNKYGQEYYCKIPSPPQDKGNETVEIVHLVTSNITDRLELLRKRSCMKKVVGWWTYEFCYGESVKQYHVGNDGEQKGNTISMGYYDSEQQWNKDVNVSAHSKEALYHSQFYTNGTLCDLSSKLRRTEIRFVCEEGTSAYIQRVDEPVTCQYLITVKTGLICDLPGFLPPSSNSGPLRVECQPALAKEKFESYQRVLEARRKKAEEESKQMREADSQSLLTSIFGDKSSDIENEASDDDLKTSQAQKHFDLADKKRLLSREKVLLDKAQSMLQQMLKKQLQDLSLETAEGDAEDKPLSVSDFLQGKVGLKKSNAKTSSVSDGYSKSSETKSEEEKPNGPTLLDSPEVEPSIEADETDLTDSDDDEKLFSEFDRELSKISKKTLSKLDTDLIKSEMEQEFDALVAETERELEREGLLNDDLRGLDPDDQSEAFRTLAQTLSRLLDRIDQTEDNLRKANEKLKKFKKDNQLHHSKGPGEPREDSEQDQRKASDSEALDISQKRPQNDDAKTEQTEEEYSETQVVLPSGQVVIQQHKTKDAEMSSSEADAATTAKDATALNKDSPLNSFEDNVKVRVSKVKSSARNINPDSFRRKLSSQTQRLEEQLSEKLKKAGFDTKGRNVQVKIITTGFVDEEGGEVEMLSDTESNQFSNIIVSILGGDVQQLKETRRMRALESNYDFSLEDVLPFKNVMASKENDQAAQPSNDQIVLGSRQVADSSHDDEGQSHDVSETDDKSG